MKISGQEFLAALSEYFNRPDFSFTNIALLFFLPLLIYIVWVIASNSRNEKKNPFDDIPENEMSLIVQISAQKGLSSFDRDFLIMQALNFYIKPTKILLDRETFERVLKKLEDNAKKTGMQPESDEIVKNMFRLKEKLF